MDAINTPGLGSRERRIGLLADELRAEAVNGLYFHPDDDDTERFVRLRGLAARLMAQVDDREPAEIESVFAADKRLRTPLLGVVLILSHQRDGLMMVVDPRSGRPGFPARFVPTDLEPEAALRELTKRILPEEEVVPVPHGICDSIAAGLPMSHTYYLTYVVDITFLPSEAIAEPLVAADQLTTGPDELSTYIMDGAERRVLDAPFYLPEPVAELLLEVADVAAEGGAATDDPWNVERYQRIAETANILLSSDRDDAPLVPVRFDAMEVATPYTAGEMLIMDDQGRMLLMKRSDTGEWAIPGGASEVGETSAATAVRECQEELGVEVTVDGLAGVYDNRAIKAPRADGFVCFLYVGRLADGSPPPRRTREAVDFAWYRPEQISTLDMFNAHDVKIDRALKVIAG
ncbi:ADP-ribose pyrophosphatase YjhB (NUDIX family) [Stackebrandtia endophytica]|uniref:ADP-ribose pyrophosphatase YjhB (NUDIX family) n=1 Tax=Stackebrandtia endophytica TaxID=1496996 RepID=A0A543AZZ9_9ACTN|nr:NUDIX hydrolase N-terminal domain-containing protein [Stackebrandtia endophytica]TQL78165.1 ADP-ribose pyrophosphatase YjhB (NUDIX family) [Stackebrandtia endophytica]